jgi:hypothetical protein
MCNNRPNWKVLRLAVALAALFASFVPSAVATIRIQEEALSHGYPASNCGYCHTFDSSHMKEEARKKGMSRLDCQACHHGRLPKSGINILNGRGRFLVAAKRQFRAEKVDGAWLENYHEPSPAPSPKPQPRK